MTIYRLNILRVREILSTSQVYIDFNNDKSYTIASEQQGFMIQNHLAEEDIYR
jgi:hypothetical protein